MAIRSAGCRVGDELPSGMVQIDSETSSGCKIGSAEAVAIPWVIVAIVLLVATSPPVVVVAAAAASVDHVVMISEGRWVACGVQNMDPTRFPTRDGERDCNQQQIMYL